MKNKIKFLIICCLVATHTFAEPPHLIKHLGFYEVIADDLFADYPDWNDFDKTNDKISVSETSEKNTYYWITTTEDGYILEGFFPATMMKGIKLVLESTMQKKMCQTDEKNIL